MDCEENDSTAECDTTGRPCHPRAVVLAAENFKAWELYHVLQMPELVARAVLTLDPVTVDGDVERDALARKLEALTLTYAELERERMERERAEARARSGR